ncbi:hypothetical protein SGPA1_12251 [Streptomyces misionensis JCM 4497]
MVRPVRERVPGNPGERHGVRFRPGPVRAGRRAGQGGLGGRRADRYRGGGQHRPTRRHRQPRHHALRRGRDPVPRPGRRIRGVFGAPRTPGFLISLD